MTGGIFDSFKSGGVVYRITCLATYKEYIGATISSKKRFATHLCSLRAGRHYNKEMQREFLLHGENAFSFMIISTHATYESALRKEARLIKALAASKRNYNMIVDIDVGEMKRRAVARHLRWERYCKEHRERAAA